MLITSFTNLKNYIKNHIDSIINFFKEDYKQFKQNHLNEIKNNQKNNQKNEQKNEQDEFKKINNDNDFNNYFDLNELEDQKIIDELRSKISKENEIKMIDINSLNLNPDKINFLLSDDHPGALFQMYNDVKTILKKQYDFIQINDENKNKIINCEFNINDFNIIKIGSELAPYKIKNLILQQNLKIDIAIIDIIYGGVVLKDNKSVFLDGIDLAKIILENNPDALILFYSGCSLNNDTEETTKLKKIINEYPKNIFYTDKDLNNDVRIEKIIELLEIFKKNKRNNNEKS